MSSTPQKATAAQLASRKIIHGRAARRMASSRLANFQAPQPSQQPGQSPFGSVDPNTVNGNATLPLPSSGFNFGQPNGGSSQTFPQDNSSNMPPKSQSTSFGGFGSGSDTNTGFNPQGFAPTSDFNFSVGSGMRQNNPFTGASNSLSTTPTPGGYQGAIFNLPTTHSIFAPPNSLFREHEDTTDHVFAPHAPFNQQNNHNNQNNQDNQNTQNNQNVFPQPTSSVFNQTPSQQQQMRPPSNVFGQSNSQSISNMFVAPASQQQEKQPTPDMFGQSRPQQIQAANNFFGSSESQPQQAQPSSNMFGQFSSPSNQPKISFFGQNAIPEPHSQSDSNASAQFGDSMHISPDNSPQKIDQPRQGAFSFLNSQPQTNSDNTTITPGQGGSLFDRITRPTPTTVASTASVQGGFLSTDRYSNASAFTPTKNATEQPGSSTDSPSAPAISFGNSSANTSAFSSLSQASSTASIKEADKRAIGNRPIATPTLAKPSSDNAKMGMGNPFTSLIFPSHPQPCPASPNSTIAATMSSSSSENPGDTGFRIKGISATSNLPASNQKQETAITSSRSPTFRNMGTPLNVPAHFTEAQKQQMITGYQMRSLDMGLKKYMLGSGFFSEPLLITRFYLDMKEEIMAAQGSAQERLAGTKRKSIDNETDLDGNGPNKKSRVGASSLESPTKGTSQVPLVPRTETNGPTANTPLFDQPAPDNLVRTGAKRAADEDLVRNNADDVNGTSKKARWNDEISHPSLPSSSQPTQGSETSNILKGVLGKPDNKSPSTPMPSASGTLRTGSSTQNLSTKPSKSSATTTVENLLSNNPSSSSASTGTYQARPTTPFSGAGTVSSSLAQTKPALSSSNATDKSSMISSTSQFKPSSSQTSAGSALTNPFTTKPVTPGAASPDKFKASSVKVPTFDNGAPVNFLNQSGKAAEEDAKKEKEKRKAKELDSDEDNEAEGAGKDVEEQRAKKQKVVEAAKGDVAKFKPGSPQTISPGGSAPPSFQFGAPKPTPSAAGGPSGFGALTSIPGSGTSVFSNPKAFGAQNGTNKNNIFGHLSAAESGPERSQTGDADDESSDSGADSDGVNGEDPKEGADNKRRSTQTTDPVPSTPLKSPRNQEKLLRSSTPMGNPLERVASVEDRKLVPFKLSSAIVPGDFTPQSSPSRMGTSGPFNQASPSPASSVPGQPSSKTVATSPASSLFGQPSSKTVATSPASSAFGQPSLKTAATSPASSVFGQPSSKTGATSPASSAFGQPSSKTAATSPASSVFAQPSSKTVAASPFGALGSPAGDHTWKQDRPIKFGNTGSAPGWSVTPATPTKPAAAEQKGSPSSGFSGLFGAAKPATLDAASKPATNFFGAGTSAAKSPDAGFGFGFGGPPKSATNALAPPSGLASDATSRATSPGATTGGESANESTAEGAEGEAEHHEQINLAAGGPGEENEDILFEVRAKGLIYDSEKKEWSIQGLGPVRVLKDRQTGKARILLRQDPSGRILLNAALMSEMSYEYSKPKGVKMGVATDGKFSTWMIKVGKDGDATRLSSVLEDNKSN
ncbi:MAG: hypothetical protein FRX48_00817 [Lasallia pustulata]|uniref:RanBD1 domain-containing protein n=1 Tax=Lasallia pustulata TaxID=136370 RepID=A0A5M8Q1W1_9LECA|nr:MAG: hypothetical protein FRX48_00817 [Lasallia pustulata]